VWGAGKQEHAAGKHLQADRTQDTAAGTTEESDRRESTGLLDWETKHLSIKLSDIQINREWAATEAENTHFHT
jgi:hypothetical protein